MTVNVLFVCTGNICRSPMAEAVFDHLVAQEGLSDRIHSDSAGTDSYHNGDSPHHGTMRILKAQGINGYEHISRRLTRSDLTSFDYAIAMDEDHYHALHSMAHNLNIKSKIALLLDYAPHLAEREVPDPYYNNRFDQVYELVEAGCRGLLAEIRKQQGW